ncbi:hypothetical protein Rxyl_1915 [Rubrobacter xylanophilus DSM 9941]|uniref:Uncharacterized protein n=1 Tax=Rubrobacter xylanophilus (strain DSM 9941 / JCM 11954 / NBRC 16129 / PRD-1) TaxID=266117 RepID=Q1AUR6_RUBXD|nr:hypothetical protein [Rubrobacter xylanophilus]ABG04862.1 hypothetical protein Rxyl_1915 [Rubrobacter xylanophilus DSM 9941]
MNSYAELARRRREAQALYLELHALGLEVRAEPDAGRPAGYRVVVGGLKSLNPDHADRLMRLVRYDEAGLIEVLWGGWDPDLPAIRQEGHGL